MSGTLPGSSAATGWFTSSSSASDPSCVDVRVTGPAVRVRDTKRPGPSAGLPAAPWARLLDTVTRR